jgi:hypothetical protein
LAQCEREQGEGRCGSSPGRHLEIMGHLSAAQSLGSEEVADQRPVKGVEEEMARACRHRAFLSPAHSHATSRRSIIAVISHFGRYKPCSKQLKPCLDGDKKRSSIGTAEEH